MVFVSLKVKLEELIPFKPTESEFESEKSSFEVVDSEVMQTSYGFHSTLDLFRFLHGIGATLGPRKLKPSSLRGIIEACDQKRLQNSQRQLESNWVFGRFLCRSI